MKNLLVALFFLILFSNQAKAILANSQPKDYTLPNGKTITIKQHGDENFNWITTIDGYRIAKNVDGYFVYVSLLKSGATELSEMVANNPNDRAVEEISYISTLPQNLGVKQQVETLKKVALKSGQLKSSTIAFPSKGVRKNLLILATFSDKSPTYSQTDFNNLMNQPNYGGIGSFRDYYLENSNNTLDITTTVTVWVTVPNTYLYYSNSTKWAQFAYDAIKAADSKVDYSKFEISGSQLTSVTIIHQGHGAETSTNSNDIWSHRGVLSDYKLSTSLRTFDGVILNNYSISAEILNSSLKSPSLGVFAHEFGHLLGLPDFYDANYEMDGKYDGTGQWDIMGAGAYLGSYNTFFPGLQQGACPANHNALSKSFLKWITIPKINSPQSLVLNIDSAFRIDTSTPKEYYILENRKKSGFDAQLPGEGMLIYHVDSSWIGQNPYSINTGSHQGLYLKVASGEKTNTPGCTYPGITDSTSFTDNTLPNMKSWAGNNTNKSITNINRGANGIVTFDFMSIQNGSPQTFEVKQHTTTIDVLNWSLSTSNSPVLVAFSTSESFGAPVVGNSYKVGDVLPGGGRVLYIGSGTTINHTNFVANTMYYYKIWSNNNLVYSTALKCYIKTANCVSSFPWKDTIGSALDNWHQEWIGGTNTVWKARNGGFLNRPSRLTDASEAADTCIVHITQLEEGSSQSRLISPTFITDPNKPYRLLFKHVQPAHITDQDKMRLLIKPMLDRNWTELDYFNSDIPNWRYQEYDLPSMSQPFQIAFESDCYNGYGISIDSVSIIQAEPLATINHKIIVKNGNKLISGAIVTLLTQTQATNAQGEVMFLNQKPNKNWQLLKVEADGYEGSYTKLVAMKAIIDTINLIKSEAITPTNFIATKNYQTTTLQWNPVIDESFEGYTPWNDTIIGNWILKDRDKGNSGSYKLFDYPNSLYPSSFVVFDGSYEGRTYFFQPHSGKQMAVAFFSAKSPNNDWMISPRITIQSGDYLELYAKTANDEWGLEKMRILISETDTATTSFKRLSTDTINVPSTWTKYNNDLTTFAGKKVFLAINCISDDKYALLIDDIKLKNSSIANNSLVPVTTSNTSRPDSLGNIEYQIVRDGSVVATVNGFGKNSYSDKVNDCLTHKYAVQTNYLSPAKRSEPTVEQEVVSCRIVKIIVADNTKPSVGISVKIDNNIVMTNNLGEALFDGISDNTHILSITQLGYTAINEAINISKDTIITKEIVPLALGVNSTFNNIRLSPYPCNGNFTLTNTDMPVPFSYSIISITGDIVQSGEITKVGDTNMSINSSTSGTYLLKMTYNGMVETRKILVLP